MSKVGMNLVRKLEDARKFLPQVKKLRLQRVQDQLTRHNFAAAILFEPVNIRYATDIRNCSLWNMHTLMRYVLIPAEGEPTVFEYGAYASDPNVKSAIPTADVVVGPRIEEKAKLWAEQLTSYLQPITAGFGCNRIAIERPIVPAVFALVKNGFDLYDASEVMSDAKMIKVEGELELIETSMAVVSEAVLHVRDALMCGVTENKLWSILNQKMFEFDGEWIETRLILSGKKSNPWNQESSMKVINQGELVGLDTDAVGPFNYCIDFSRTFICPGPDGEPVKPTDKQKDLYKYAYEQIQHNVNLIKPGMGIRKISDKAWKIPEKFVKNRYGVMVHGVGMCDEPPIIAHRHDFEDIGYDGVIEENMTLCVESYIGEDGGHERVKLEEHVLITPEGAKVLSTLVPFEQDFLS